VIAAGRAEAAVEVQASVDTSAAYVGDLITYQVRVTYDEGDSVQSIPHGINLYSFRVRDYHPIERQRTKEGRWQEGGTYRIAAYRPGTYVIPPIPVEYRTASGRTGELVTQPLTIEIKSLGVGEGDTLRDIKPPVRVPVKVQRWVWVTLAVLAGGVLVAVLGALWMRRWALRAEEPPYEAEVVDEIAEFDHISAQDLFARGEIKALYVLVSEAMRRYIGRRYRVSAMELTHEELEATFADAHISEDEAALLLDFLARCDLVKFARFVPPDEEVLSLIERAKEVVRRTQFAAEPTPEAVAEPVAANPAEGKA